jgi:hypothetical protein
MKHIKVTKGIEEVSILVGNGSTLNKNMKERDSIELNCLCYHDDELFKDG